MRKDKSMITKELGDHIRAGTLTKVFGAKIAVSLTTWYRTQTLSITQISYDGKDLPKFEPSKLKEEEPF